MSTPSMQELAPSGSLQAITLPAPRLTGGMPLMQALKERKSIRSFRAGALAPEVLSDLLWAAWGVNRPSEGKRTAPSAINIQEIDLYAILAQGAYVYQAKEHRLAPVAEGDLRVAAVGTGLGRNAAVVLVYVADRARMKGISSARQDAYSAAHAGFIGQNVYLYCASGGLGAVFVEYVDRVGLRGSLKLRDDQTIVFGQVVGLLS